MSDISEEMAKTLKSLSDGGAKKVRKVKKQKGGEGEEDIQSSFVDDVPLTNIDDMSLSVQDGSGKRHKKYNGRTYVVRTGSRGGHYLLVKGKKVYI